MSVYSVDPGDDCMYARWEHATLSRCGDYWTDVTPFLTDTLVIENQVIIPRLTKKPANIITLAHTAGCVMGDFGYPVDKSRVTKVNPKTWKGGTKKPKAASKWATYQIHRMVVAALLPGELVIYLTALEKLPNSQRHDLADAVGIGLHHFGRLVVVRTEKPRDAGRLERLAKIRSVA